MVGHGEPIGSLAFLDMEVPLFQISNSLQIIVAGQHSSDEGTCSFSMNCKTKVMITSKRCIGTFSLHIC